MSLPCQAWHSRGGDNDGYNRDIRSYNQVTAFHLFGGMMWLQIFIAIGTITVEIVDIVNSICAARRQKDGGSINDAPRLSKRNACALEEAELPSKQGVKHTRSHAKKLRSHANRLERNAACLRKKWLKEERITTVRMRCGRKVRVVGGVVEGRNGGSKEWAQSGGVTEARSGGGWVGTTTTIPIIYICFP